MQFRLKYILTLLVIGLIINPLVAQKPRNVTLHLTWKHQFQFAGYYAAIEKGYYREVGLEVKLVEAVEGQNPTEAVFNGSAEFGVCNTDILLARSKNKEPVILATIFQHSSQILLASKKSGIENVHDLIGKRIALGPNSADIIAFMNDERIPLEKCIIEQNVFDVNKLINGEIDAISAYSTDQPFNLQEANFPYTIISPSMGGIDFYGDMLFTTKSFIQKNPEIAGNFRNASLKGWRYAMDHPEEIIDLIYNKYSNRHSIPHLRFEAERMNSLIMDDLVEIGYTNPGRWVSISDTYKKLKMLDSSFTINDLLYFDYAKTKPNIPWNLILLLLFSILMIGSVAYFFYNSSRKLKNEIRNRHNAEKILLESEEKYRAIFENNSAATAIIETDTTVSMVNEAYCQMSGFTAEEVIGTSWTQQIPPQDLERLKEYNRRRLINPRDAPDKYEFTFFHKSGEIKHSLMSVSMIQGNGKILISFIDISKRKRAEKELFESEQRYRLLFETANEGILVAQGKRLVFVNPAMIELIGYSKEEIFSLSFLEFVCKDDWELVLSNQLKRISGDGADVRYHLRILRKDKSIKWVEMSGVKIEWEGQPATMNFVTDITERKKAEEEINLKNEQLLKLNSEKDKFFSIIAHDLRSPFTGFLGLTQIMAEELSSLTMGEIQDISVRMRNSANNLFSLLENLLEWARMQQGLIPYDPKSIQLLSAVNECVEMVHESAIMKGIKIGYNIPDDLIVFADGKLLQTIIRNLVSNAVKFTAKGGEISILTEATSEKSVEISVKDSGIGMSSKMVNDLFRLDVQTNRLGTEGEPSTGIGLLLCKEFVAKLGGKIWVESEPGKGSTFYFTLPSKVESAVRNVIS